MPDNQTLQGKVAIVTGASRGIGRTIAEQLSELGAKVIINYASSPQKAEEVVRSIRSKGGEAAAVQADLSRVPEVEALFPPDAGDLRANRHPHQ
ncbi:short-chain dehydrogenase/reductase SDR [Paenibacillus mucilaginosus KNP414]|uniref:Short-chain dehydrogenase/reductase SDR n=1 Tax=Paenibacillus mucilaginosus (strain KNP414) TaxID=1036673 RepID=F8FDY5_PAEMK|nr:short-chain dehydrogenase/reductase SDR [Paenibacillus mucilaginosus KNP414]